MKDNKYTVNDFFCGAGGASIGLTNAGFNVIWACDFDKFAYQTYRHNVGDHIVQADITKLKWSDIPHADGWFFSWPCQDLSNSGKKAGFKFKCNNCGNVYKYQSAVSSSVCPVCGSPDRTAETRSGCFFEIMRLLDETKNNDPDRLPKFLLAENVKGLRPYVPALKEEFEVRGYEAHVQLYNSKYWNVPQNRERYFIVGTRKDLGGDFKFPEEQHEYVPKLSSILDKEVDEKYYIPDEKAQTIIKQALERLEKMGKVHPCLTVDRENKRQNGRRAKENEADMFTLTAQDHHGIICDETGFLDPDGTGKTLRVGGGGSLTKKHNYQHILIDRLVITEDETDE